MAAAGRYVPKRGQTKFVSGPMSLTKHYNFETETTIYMFGEMHGRENSCTDPEAVSITEYLEELFLYTDKKIDFYLETPVFIKEEPTEFGTDFYIDRLRKWHHELAANFPLLRAHYVDVRPMAIPEIGTKNMPPKTSILQKTGAYIFEYLNGRNRTFDSLFTIVSNLKKVINRGIEGYYNGYLKDKGHIIGDAINKSYLKDEIVEFSAKAILQEYGRAILIIERFIKIIEENMGNDIDENIIFHSLEKINVFIILITFAELDAYTLALIFRMPESSDSEFEGAKNIIFYGGEAHSENMRKFIETVGFILLESASKATSEDGEKLDRCLDISDMTRPLFE